MTTDASITVKATLTVHEAAALLGIGRGLAYEQVLAGRIPSIRLGRRILVPRAALEAMLAKPNEPGK